MVKKSPNLVSLTIVGVFSVWAQDIAATCTAKNQPPSNVWAKDVLQRDAHPHLCTAHYIPTELKDKTGRNQDWNDPKAMTIRKSLGMIPIYPNHHSYGQKMTETPWRTPPFPPASPWVMDGPTSIPHFVGLILDCRVEAIVEVPSVQSFHISHSIAKQNLCDLNKGRNLRSKS